MRVSIADLPPEFQRQMIEKLKYNNKPTQRGNIKFDSKKEAKRYDELMMLLRAEKIRKLKLQEDITIQEAFTTTEGERVRAIRYRADFTYERKTAPDINGFEHWVKVVEDVKGVKTPEYNMKKKLLLEKGIVVEEV